MSDASLISRSATLGARAAGGAARGEADGFDIGGRVANFRVKPTWDWNAEIGLPNAERRNRRFPTAFDIRPSTFDAGGDEPRPPRLPATAGGVLSTTRADGFGRRWRAAGVRGDGDDARR